MPVAATPSRAVIVLARESGRHAPTSICAWMDGVPAVATSCGAISGLTCAGGRRAPANIWAWTEGVITVAATPRRAIVELARDGGRRAPAVVCASMEGEWRSPQHVKPLSNLPMTMTARAWTKEGAGRRHTLRAVAGLARDRGRRALAIICAWT
jgi:hypothetical protein